jgi:PiT family inorganic phosphate transporter
MGPILALLVTAAFVLAYANGANDNFKATATAYGSGTLGYDAARRLATFAQLAGSLASIALATGLLEAFSGKGLVPAEVVGDPRFLVAVAAGGAATVLLATRVGLPISTTHALVGGLAGAGLALAPGQLSWAALGGGYFVPLLVSPLLATAAAGLLYPLAHAARERLGVSRDTCLCIGERVDPVDVGPDGTLLLRHSGLPLSLGEPERCRELYRGQWLGVSVQALVDRLHLGSAFALGFARGLNDTPKVLALLVAAGWSGIDPRLSLAGVAAAMAAGGWLRARKVAETLAHRITSLSHGQGLLANGVASTLVIGASLLGSPVSTTHVSTGALFGIGAWSARTDWSVVGGILLAWVGTLPLAAALAAATALSLAA